MQLCSKSSPIYLLQPEYSCYLLSYESNLLHNLRGIATGSQNIVFFFVFLYFLLGFIYFVFFLCCSCCQFPIYFFTYLLLVFDFLKLRNVLADWLAGRWVVANAAFSIYLHIGEESSSLWPDIVTAFVKNCFSFLFFFCCYTNMF